MSKDEAGEGMSDRELRDEIMTLMVAGQETSAILLTWVCTLMAWHPDIQAMRDYPTHLSF
jgi:cytochrome P450